MIARETTDQRKTIRIPHIADIRYSATEQDEYRPARMFNYSPEGMYLELTYPPPKLGANLLIEVLDQVEGQEESGLDPLFDVHQPIMCYYAQVIWKKNLPQITAGYGVGLRYLRSVASD